MKYNVKHIFIENDADQENIFLQHSQFAIWKKKKQSKTKKNKTKQIVCSILTAYLNIFKVPIDFNN